MNNLWNYLNGKKTYIVAGVTALYLIAVEGWHNNNWRTEDIIKLLLVMTGKSAWDKSQKSTS